MGTYGSSRSGLDRDSGVGVLEAWALRLQPWQPWSRAQRKSHRGRGGPGTWDTEPGVKTLAGGEGQPRLQNSHGHQGVLQDQTARKETSQTAP